MWPAWVSKSTVRFLSSENLGSYFSVSFILGSCEQAAHQQAIWLRPLLVIPMKNWSCGMLIRTFWVHGLLGKGPTMSGWSMATARLHRVLSNVRWSVPAAATGLWTGWLNSRKQRFNMIQPTIFMRVCVVKSGQITIFHGSWVEIHISRYGIKQGRGDLTKIWGRAPRRRAAPLLRLQIG